MTTDENPSLRLCPGPLLTDTVPLTHPPPCRNHSFAAHQFLSARTPPQELSAASPGLCETPGTVSVGLSSKQGWTPVANCAKLSVGYWCLKEKRCVPGSLAKGLISRLPEEEVGEGELIQCMQTQEEPGTQIATRSRH